jgi:hypothetical protein
MILLTLGLACSNECADVGRIEGTYDVFGSINQYELDPVDADMPTYAPWYHGSREWTLSYVPAAERFNILIEGQELTAKYEPGAGTCNAFRLTVPSTDWVTEVTALGDTGELFSTHDAAWVADMVWQGDEISGTYDVTDVWFVNETRAGTLTATGTVSGQLVAGGGGADE